MSDRPVRLVSDAPASAPEVPHLRSDPHALQRSFLAHVQYTRGQGPDRATPWDKFLALAMLVRDRLAERWVATKRTYRSQDAKRAYYLSAEYLLGRALGNNLINHGAPRLGAGGAPRDGGRSRRAARARAGRRARQRRPRPPRGVLPRLDGHARLPGDGLRHPLRVRHLPPGHHRRAPGRARRRVAEVRQPLGDRPPGEGGAGALLRPVERGSGRSGAPASRWVGGKTVLGVPYDTPIAGFGADTVNTLRLWQARASDEFDFHLFNDGDYERSVVEKNDSEVISKVLYPNDQNQAGKELRLQAGVLLRRLLHRGHRPPLPEDATRLPRTSPRRSRSSSTTPTRRSPSPS